MRSVLSAVFALFMTSAVLAGTVDGTIKSVDNDTQTIMLDGDDAQYKLSSEVDFTGLKAGLEVTIAFDKINGVNIVTDMDIWEQD